MNGNLGRKAAIMAVAALMAAASGTLRADHDVDIVTPLVTLFAVGALLNYDHGSHHYYHYYRYRRHGHSGNHYSAHSSRHGYHRYEPRRHEYYRKRQSSHGYHAPPRRRSSSHGGYHRH